jgi:hypothetical protein
MPEIKILGVNCVIYEKTRNSGLLLDVQYVYPCIELHPVKLSCIDVFVVD